MTPQYGWGDAYFAAALETDWTTMLERIKTAETRIGQRQLIFLADHGGTPDERKAISSALVALNVLRSELVEWREHTHSAEPVETGASCIDIL